MASSVEEWNSKSCRAAQVLADVRTCLRQLKMEGAGNGLENLMSSRSMFVAEVEDAARWTIKALGKGAADLLQVPQKSPTLPSPTFIK